MSVGSPSTASPWMAAVTVVPSASVTVSSPVYGPATVGVNAKTTVQGGTSPAQLWTISTSSPSMVPCSSRRGLGRPVVRSLDLHHPLGRLPHLRPRQLDGRRGRLLRVTAQEDLAVRLAVVLGRLGLLRCRRLGGRGLDGLGRRLLIGSPVPAPPPSPPARPAPPLRRAYGPSLTSCVGTSAHARPVRHNLAHRRREERGRPPRTRSNHSNARTEQRRRAVTPWGDRPSVDVRLTGCTDRSRSPPAERPGRSPCRTASSRCRRSRRPSTSRPWPPRSARPGCCGSGTDPYRPG